MAGDAPRVLRQEHVPPWTVQLRRTEDPAGWEVVTRDATQSAAAEIRQGHYLALPEAEDAYARMVDQYRQGGGGSPASQSG